MYFKTMFNSIVKGYNSIYINYSYLMLYICNIIKTLKPTEIFYNHNTDNIIRFPTLISVNISRKLFHD